jgi:HAE1 family hydrophobic/amphiphilic exporter-1
MIRWATSRPAVIWASILVVLVAGAVSFTRLALATKTSVELPRLSVSAGWPYASAELIEMYVAAPIEGAVQGIRGVRRTTSESQEGNVSVTLELDPRADVQTTRLAILERLRTAVTDSAFPPNVIPMVSNYVPEDLREQPLLRLTVTGPYTRGTLQKFVREQVLARVSAVPGVGNASLGSNILVGAAITYDPRLLRQLDIDPSILVAALRDARKIAALGDETLGASVRHVILRDEPGALEELMNLPIRTTRGRIFHLGELARVTPEEDTGGNFTRIDGQPALALTIFREPTADAIRTATAVRAALDTLGRALPTGVSFKITYDDSSQLAIKLRDLIKRGLIAFAAVLVVLLVTIRNVRGVMLVMGTAVVSIAGTALGLYLFEIPANLLTLAGLGMGIGILVQNGVIVVDRLGRAPDTPEGRADAGTRIFPAVLGATLTTVVVLFPFLYLQGNARAAFVPFASAFTLALAWSVLAAVVMIPAIGAGHGMRGRGWPRLLGAYAWLMRGLLRWRWATVVVSIGTIAALSWLFYKRVPRFSWSGYGSQSSYINVNVSFPRGSDPETPDRTIQEFERMAVRSPGVSQVIVSGSTRSSNMKVEFAPEAEMTAIPMVLLDDLTQRGVLIGGASIGVHGFGASFNSGGGSGSNATFRIKILGFSYNGVLALAEDLKIRLQQIARVRDVRITSGSFYWGSERSYMATLEPDRAALARFGLTAGHFANAVQQGVRGAPGATTRITVGGEEVPVALKSDGTRERTIDELRETIIPGAIGRSPVRIGDVATVGETEALNVISREDQQYVRIVTYDFRGPPRLADRTHKSFMAATSVPVGYSVSDDRFSWGVRDNSDKGLWLVFGIGVVLVVLSVAIVFDSMWAAAMVFLSLPLALAGVEGAFWLAKAAFTREAAVGVILVVGLAVNQATLIIDAALEHRRRNLQLPGRPAVRVSDVYHAALDRAGMIMLVTLVTLASLIPLAINTKVTDLFGAIALATAGGTVAGTIGAMFIMPPLMVLWTRGKRAKKTQLAAPEAVPS